MRRLTVLLALALTTALGPAPGHAAAPVAETVTAEISAVRYQQGDGAFVVAVCQVRATGRPANTGAYCRIDNLPYEMAMYPNSPNAVQVLCASATVPFVVCAGGEVWYRDATLLRPTEDCEIFDFGSRSGAGSAATPFECGVG